MKKFSALVCVLLVATLLSACQSFYADTNTELSNPDPLTVAVFLQVNHLPLGTTVDEALAAWLGDVNRLIETTPAGDGPHLTAVTPDEDATATGTITMRLTIANPPAELVKRTTRPFQITLTHQIFNPIRLLPASPVFGYVVGFTTKRRHSAANTNLVTTDEDGQYVYLWTSNDTDDATADGLADSVETLEFVDVYPNRPLYYLLVLVGAAVLGLIVYLVSRDYDCKNPQKQL